MLLGQRASICKAFKSEGVLSLKNLCRAVLQAVCFIFNQLYGMRVSHLNDIAAGLK